MPAANVANQPAFSADVVVLGKYGTKPPDPLLGLLSLIGAGRAEPNNQARQGKDSSGYANAFQPFGQVLITFTVNGRQSFKVALAPKCRITSPAMGGDSHTEFL